MPTPMNLGSLLIAQATDHSYLICFTILGLLLFMGQAFNFLRLRKATASETDRKVRVIIASWWKIAAALFFAFLGGKFSAIPFFYVLSLYALKEYVAVSKLRDQPKSLYLAGFLGITLHYAGLALHLPVLFFASLQIFSVLVVMPVMVFTSRLTQLAELMAFCFGVMGMAVLMSFPAAVLAFEADIFGSELNARMAVLLLIVLTEVNDILQFICGKLFGRRKIIPMISPNKTEAGFIGGALLSTLLGAFLWPHFSPLTILQGAILGFLLSLAGMMGDLVCSAIKRYRGIKDFSSLIPGHGGVLDRVDSLLATAPVFFYFLYLFHRGLL